MNELNKNQDADRIALLLKQAMPPMTARSDVALKRDLWPAMLNRFDDNKAVSHWDKALITAVLAWLLFFPGSIPVLFYYL
jgi:hypothetical protein